jgi:clan AA aspartic protease
MIRGAVNARHEAVLTLRLRGPAGAEFDVDVVIDTAFTGTLTLPAATIAALGLAQQASTPTALADGTVRILDTYDAEVEWDGSWRGMLVTEIESSPLLGTRLLARHEVFIEFVPGGVVDVSKLP